MIDALGRLGGIHKAIQSLDIRPTPGNVRTLTAIYNTLEQLYHELEAQEEERDDDGTTADPGPGRAE